MVSSLRFQFPPHPAMSEAVNQHTQTHTNTNPQMHAEYHTQPHHLYTAVYLQRTVCTWVFRSILIIFFFHALTYRILTMQNHKLRSLLNVQWPRRAKHNSKEQNTMAN